MITQNKKTLFSSYSVLTIAFIFCYFNTFKWFIYKYNLEDSYYSHGYLIPFISLYLIYSMRNKLNSIKIKSNLIGFFIIVLSLLIHITAVMVDINFISGFSLLLYIVGCCIFLWGFEFTKTISFPLFFIVLMLPVPDIFLNTLGLPTKTLATDIGLFIIRLLDIPFFREGFRINLTDTVLVVGTPCNGMKSLISFFALALLYVYMMRFKFYQSALIIALIYPLAVVVNGFRIAMLVYIADTYGIEKASPESFLHDLSGIIVFIIGLFFLLISLTILKRFNRVK